MPPKYKYSWEQEEEAFAPPSPVYGQQQQPTYYTGMNTPANMTPFNWGIIPRYYGRTNQNAPLYNQWSDMARGDQQVTNDMNRMRASNWQNQRNQWAAERNQYAVGFNRARPEYGYTGKVDKSIGEFYNYSYPETLKYTVNPDTTPLAPEFSSWYGTLDKRGATPDIQYAPGGPQSIKPNDAQIKDMMKFNYTDWSMVENPAYQQQMDLLQKRQELFGGIPNVTNDPNYPQYTPQQYTLQRKALSLPDTVKYRNAQGKMIEAKKPGKEPIKPAEQPIPQPDKESFNKFVSLLNQNKQTQKQQPRGVMYAGGGGGGGGGGGYYGGGGGGGGYSPSTRSSYNPWDYTGLINWRI